MSTIARVAALPLSLFALPFLASLACSSDDAAAMPHHHGEAAPKNDVALRESDALYDPDHVVAVDITMDPADWERILAEGRSITEVYSGCAKPLAYSWATASVTVDGVTMENVAVRKKGFLGSLSQVRPALKLDFNRNVKGQKIYDVKGLTLNNDKQDPSHTHQCMAYQLFSAAKLPAPRCNFAKVTVNGKALGIYSNVEPIKGDFLARHFESSEGNLYEGSGGADFEEAVVGRFQRESNKGVDDRSDLARAVEAVHASDAAFDSALDAVFDVDALLTYWAMETITGHWDGYSGNSNNYYIYRDPKSGKFTFIPWGTDDAFYPGHLNFPAANIPKSAFASSWLAYRLYANPSYRAKYQQKLRWLLDTVWNEEALLREVDRIAGLTSADERALERQRMYIRTRKQQIVAELDSGAPDWRYRPVKRQNPPICLPSFSIEGRFDAGWGDLSAGLAPSPQNFFKITDADKPIPAFPFDLRTSEINQSYATTMASSGFNTGDDPKVPRGTPAVWLVGVQGSKGSNIAVALMLEPVRFGAHEMSFFGLETFGAVSRTTGPGQNQTIGMIGDGKIVFDEVSAGPGGRVRGTFSGQFVPTVFDQRDR